MTRLVVCSMSPTLSLYVVTTPTHHLHTSQTVLTSLVTLYPRRCRLATVVTVTTVSPLAYASWFVEQVLLCLTFVEFTQML